MLRPTVILDESCAGLLSAMTAFAPVFVYQRRGGFLTTPASAAAEELYATLTADNVAAPYVFVAASFGGMTALAYAARYPTTLAGLVLVDASHPEQSDAALAAIPTNELAKPAVAAFARYLQGFGPVWTESCATISRIKGLDALPMVVLAAGCPDMPTDLSPATRAALTQCWHDLQRRHAILSACGELRIVPGSNHNIVAADPEAIIAVVKKLIAVGDHS